MPLTSLSWDAAPAAPGAVALLLHGGSIEGRQANRPWSHNVARLYPIARAVAAASTPKPLAVARLRFRWRGWNGDERSPVGDARWALDQVRVRYPGVPIALVGHSMGGRTAIYLADESDVRLLVGISPWIEAGDPLPVGRDLTTVLIHGDRDTICPLWFSRETVEKLRAEGHGAALIRVARSDHAMLVRARLWSRLVTDVVVAGLADELGGAVPPWPDPVRSLAERTVGPGGIYDI
ncbi:MAG: lysophospholipase [Intrasporangium sp.]|uniref:alpha/beta hydrolase n=1 Tax=Intrasporangium sp. TaxID=1925024 RepID=UPI002648CAE6|nr:alpha/beta fold hydrolase [Intrasporangium sp.]MDN5796776.1 lysophospholipase [Intrasporangium sp.]